MKPQASALFPESNLYAHEEKERAATRRKRKGNLVLQLGFVSCDPFREIVRQDFGSVGGIGLTTAFVADGGDRVYAVNQVVIWDDDHS
ncbi:hypothetical protein K1719_038659 [Acacia pycnantha]|nr:hypothetical protein K1719_038659 [Acacia pycnantha]